MVLADKLRSVRGAMTTHERESDRAPTAGSLRVVLWLLWVGLDLPFLWGLLAFVFDFVPTLGPFLAGMPAVLFALVQLDPAHAALVAAGYVVVNVVMGDFVDPNVLGRGLSLSPWLWSSP